MKTKHQSCFSRYAGVAVMAALGVLSVAPTTVHAATTNRYSTDDHGNFLLFGNTAGFDCRDNLVEKPIVGSVPVGLLGLFSCNGLLPDNDSGIDILWRSDYPSNNRATASTAIAPADVRSTAVFALPAGAKVTMARLYWAAQRNQGQGPGTTVTFDRPGVFTRVVQGETAAAKKITSGGYDYYQSSADVTRDLQAHGNGAYRVSNIQTIDIRNVNLDVAFVAWNIVVIYHLDSEPTRNLTLFDGLEHVDPSTSSTTTVSLNGFTVPQNGFSAQLGVIAYEGDNDITGDSLKVNGTAVSNTYNPANNFFNRTSTNLNQLAPRVGDLPQMSGKPASMAGYDSDVVDITANLAPGTTSFKVDATTTGDDYYLGVFVTAVSTIRPVLSNTIKTVTNTSRTDGKFLPGDILEYTLTTTNTGNDIAKLVTLTDVLPAGLTFKTGTLTVKTGDNVGTKTDAAGDDQAEYNSANRTVTFRLGKNADKTNGGDLALNASTSVSFQVTIDTTAMGTIINQALISAVGQTAQMQGATTPVMWPSTNGNGGVNVGTPVVVSTCKTNMDCPLSAPICDLTKVPPQCVCRMDTDCPSGQHCSSTTNQCVECTNNGQCNSGGAGGACLMNGTCGCTTSADCSGGRACDTTTGTCASINTDLSVVLTRTPAGTIIAPGTPLTYTLTVSNNGQVAINGATLDAGLTPALNGTWTCVGQGGAVCPTTQGTGPVDSSINLPVGGKLVYTFTTTTTTDPVSSSLDFNGVVTPPHGYVDTNPADNTVTDSVIIGTPPLGPDLSITVTETPSLTDNSVDYIIQVTNHGPGVAPGATVTYDVPAGATVTLMPGDGWNCDRPNNGTQIICVRTAPIGVGDASPIKFNVKGMDGQSTLPVHITVGGTDGTGAPLGDPNPGDNTVDRTTILSKFGLAGGGLGSCDCSLIGSSAHTTSSSPMFGLAGFLGLALLVRSARRSRRALTARN